MTTRTITVQTPEETEVQICDECGLGDDQGELVAFQPTDPDLDADLHYHRDCAREQTGNPQTLSEAYHEAVGAELEYQIAFVLTEPGYHVLLFSIGLYTLGAATLAFIPTSFLTTPFGIALAGLASLGIAFTLWVGRDNGQKTAEELV